MQLISVVLVVDGLLDTPQDVLLKKEEDALLAQEGGAYGVSSLSSITS
jgi:hypothetical protein